MTALLDRSSITIAHYLGHTIRHHLLMLCQQSCSFFGVFSDTCPFYQFAHLLHLFTMQLHGLRILHHGAVTMLATLVILRAVRLAMLVFGLLCQDR